MGSLAMKRGLEQQLVSVLEWSGRVRRFLQQRAVPLLVIGAMVYWAWCSLGAGRAPERRNNCITIEEPGLAGTTQSYASRILSDTKKLAGRDLVYEEYGTGCYVVSSVSIAVKVIYPPGMFDPRLLEESKP